METRGSLTTYTLAIISLIAWTLVFTLVYAQSPLFTSNQNQYFLHGLANTGYGFLNEDWLANTLDPTPVFSLLVEYSYRLFGTEIIFYLYYGVLLGIYLFSIFGIVDYLFDLQGSRTKTIGFLAAFMLIHSAALRYFFSLTLNTTDILEGGVAGQRILGAVIQPSTYGVLLILSILLFLKGRVYFATVAVALAATVHPTYLLSAAVLTAAYMWIIFREEKLPGKAFSIGLLTLILVLPILFYVYSLYGSTSAESTARAREILVHIRIPHHAVISEWWRGDVIVKVIIVILALTLVRRTKLFAILMVCFNTATLLTLLQLALQNDSLALIFPWRISTLIVPLSAAIIAAYLVSIIVDWLGNKSTRADYAITILSMLTIGVLLLIGITRFTVDYERKHSTDERAMIVFVEKTKTKGDLYLVPTKMQDFRLTTGAPIFVDFKSIPYQDTDVLEWYRRVRLANKFYRGETMDCELLDQLAFGDGITHIVLARGDKGDECESLTELYRDEYYSALAIIPP